MSVESLESSEAPSTSALRDEVLFAALLPIVRLSRAEAIPLKRVAHWLHVAYFQELRGAGLKLRESAEKLGVSMRKAAALSQERKDHFLQANREAGLPRRIEFLLWAGPESRARIHQALPHEEPRDVDAALDLLLEEKRITEQRVSRTTTYRVTRGAARLVADDTWSRLDALQNLLGSVAHAMYGRFFARDAHTFARTVSFRVRKADVPELQRIYRERLWPALVQLEEACGEDDEVLAMDLSILWAPCDYLQGHHQDENQD